MYFLIHQPSCQMVAKLPKEHQSLYTKLSSQASGFIVVNGVDEETWSDDLIVWHDFGIKEAKLLHNNCKNFKPEEPLDDSLESWLGEVWSGVSRNHFYLPLLDGALVKDIVDGTCKTFKTELSKPTTASKTRKTVSASTLDDTYVVGPITIKRASGTKLLQEYFDGFASATYGQLETHFLENFIPRKEGKVLGESDARYYINKALKDGAIQVQSDELEDGLDDL